MNIGERLKEYREKNNVSQEALAKRIDIARPQLSNWERGHGEPSIMQLKNIARILAISMDELLDVNYAAKRYAVVDTSIFLKRPTIVAELIQKFDKVLLSEIVSSELSYQKNKGNNKNKQLAWLAMMNLEQNIQSKEWLFTADGNNNDEKLINSVMQFSKENNRDTIYFLTEDIDFKFFNIDCKNLELLNMREYEKKFAIVDSSYDLERTIKFFELVKYKKLVELQKYNLNGVNVNKVDASTGYTPLIQAIRNKDKTVVEYLLNLPNININVLDETKYGFSALHHAVQLKDILMVDKLLEYGADVDVGSKKKNAGNTPIMVAAWHGQKAMLEKFIQYGGCLNQQDTNGYTPLMKACIKNFTDCIGLLAIVSDKNIRSREGKKAVDYVDVNNKKALSFFQEKEEVLDDK